MYGAGRFGFDGNLLWNIVYISCCIYCGVRSDMVREYKYEVLGKDQYKVIRIDEKCKKGNKERYVEYLVDLKGSDWLCDCKGFYYSKNLCKHIKFILEQLKDKGGILNFNP